MMLFAAIVTIVAVIAAAFFFACFVMSDMGELIVERQVERFNKIAERMKGGGE